MSQNQPPPIEERSLAACSLCNLLKEQIYEDVCAECVEGTLIKHLPLLKSTLEDKYGVVLDQWLATGHFNEAQWLFSSDVHLCRERLNNFLRELVWEAIGKGEIELSLPPGHLWSPTEARPFLNSVREQCQEAILNLLRSLFLAITRTPTEEAERELIEIVSGKRQVNKWYVREEAISALMLSNSAPLPLQAKVLVELRYRADGGISPYAKVEDMEISSVWKEVGASLPKEIVKLICDNDSS